MTLNQLKVFGFRNLQDQELEFQSGLNLIWGDNGQGKTSILEAIYLLSNRSSFRGATDKELLRNGEEGYYVAGDFLDDQKDDFQIEVGYEKTGIKKVKLQGKEIHGKVQLLVKAPMVVFHPGDLVLVQGEPQARRRFLDSVFLRSSPQHRLVMANFYRTLVQRNAILKLIKNGEIERGDILPWDKEFIRWGSELSKLRESFLNFLGNMLREIYPILHGTNLQVELEYQKSLLEENLLESVFFQEQKRGFSLIGPQIEDYLIKISGRSAKSQISQGEQKLLVLGIKYAEAMFLQKQGEMPLLLLDDGLASLDTERQKSLISWVKPFSQVIITHTEKENGDFSYCHQIKGGKVL